MYYSIENRELTLSDMRSFASPEPGVGLMILDEAEKYKDELGLDDYELDSCRQLRRHFHAGIDSRDDRSFILINVINRDDVDERDRVVFLLRKNKLMLIQIWDKDDSIRTGFLEVMKARQHNAEYGAVMYDLFAQFLQSGENILDDTEEEITDMEDQLTQGKLAQELNERIFHLRSRVAKVKRYYDELVDVGEALQADDSGIFNENCQRFFKLFTNKAERLSSTAQILSDNLVHLREALTATLDYNTNVVMKIFTMVSVVFLPLTLIVGWYGMNFTNMPELTWKYGYIGVILLSVAVVIACIIYFRRKKYF